MKFIRGLALLFLFCNGLVLHGQDLHYLTKPDGTLVPVERAICSDGSGGFYGLTSSVVLHWTENSYQEWPIVGLYASNSPFFFYVHNGFVYWLKGSDLVKFNPNTGTEVITLNSNLRMNACGGTGYYQTSAGPKLYHFDTGDSSDLVGMGSINPNSIIRWFPIDPSRAYAIVDSSLFFINAIAKQAWLVPQAVHSSSSISKSHQGVPFLFSKLQAGDINPFSLVELDSTTATPMPAMKTDFPQFELYYPQTHLKFGEAYHLGGSGRIDYVSGGVPRFRFGAGMGQLRNGDDLRWITKLSDGSLVHIIKGGAVRTLPDGFHRALAAIEAPDFTWVSQNPGILLGPHLRVKTTENRLGKVVFSFRNEFAGKRSGDWRFSLAEQIATDFESGPVSNRSQSLAYLRKYGGYFWISRGLVETHKGQYNSPGYQVPQAIMDWPGNGNTSFGEPAVIAPFKDLNNNGLYEPMSGEYPDFGGDAAIFHVYNDFQSKYRTGSLQTDPLGIEVHELQEFYHYNPDTMLQQAMVFHLTIFNRSTDPIDSLRLMFQMDGDVSLDCASGTTCDDYSRNEILADPARNSSLTYEPYPLIGGYRGGWAVTLLDGTMGAHNFGGLPTSWVINGLSPDGTPYVSASGDTLSPFLNPISADTGIIRQVNSFLKEDRRSHMWSNLGQLLPGQSTCFNYISHYVKNSSPQGSGIVQAYAQQTDYLINWWNNLSIDPCTQVGLSQPDVLVSTAARVYPNPSTGDFWLEAPAAGRYTVVDLSGRQVAAGDAYPGVNSVNLPKQAGAYVLRLEMGHTVSVHKLLVQR